VHFPLLSFGRLKKASPIDPKNHDENSRKGNGKGLRNGLFFCAFCAFLRPILFPFHHVSRSEPSQPEGGKEGGSHQGPDQPIPFSGAGSDVKE
jgi:hypothetical protein